MKNSLEHIFQLAKSKDRVAQKILFNMFAGKMLYVAKSYTGNLQDAEDVVSDAFYKAFTKIEECRQANSFQFWLRKIVVNNAIDLIRKNKNVLYVDAELMEDESCEESDEIVLSDFQVDEVLQEMPLGYKLVFNLYVFENKKHQEIAEILNISIGTSKSQYSKGKIWLKNYFYKVENEKFKK